LATWASGRPLLSTTRIEALRGGSNSLGYVEGKNIAIEFRLAETAGEFWDFAAQM
jgi:hypothetical protein